MLYDLSYVNMIMYGAVLPSYSSKKTSDKSDKDIVKADDPKNRDKVRKFLETID